MATINDIKTNFNSLDEELNAYTEWCNNSVFGKTLNAIKESLKDCEPEYETEFGFTSTPLGSVLSSYEYGFNGMAKECALQVVYHLANYDYIAINKKGKATKESNHPVVAKLANELMQMVGIDATKVYESLYL